MARPSAFAGDYACCLACSRAKVSKEVGLIRIAFRKGPEKANGSESRLDRCMNLSKCHGASCHCW